MPRTPLVNNTSNQMERRENTRLGKRAASTNNNNGGTGTLSVAATVPTLTPAQMYSNFEEWIKMCTDNKVNASNTWNFALIDYFHEMTFIREGDSINFQKASCTLDGCVKIYTSRVDSVATETGKLLSGLADSSNSGEGDEDSRHGEKRARRKTTRSEVTLLKDFSSIAVKKFDLDFAVDPLFKKTSADFDEGGARGLLLNHLGIDQHCKIIFDASDAAIDCDTEELDHEHTEHTEPESQNDDPMEEDPDKNSVIEDPIDEDNVASLEDQNVGRNTTNDDENMDIDNVGEPPEEPVTKEPSPTAPSINVEENKADNNRESPVEISRLKAKLPSFEVQAGLHIVPSLKDFDFFTENDLEIPNLDHDDDEEEDAPVEEEEHDPFHFDDYDVDYGDDMDAFAFDNNNNQDDEERTDIDNEERDYAEKDFLTAMINGGDKDMFNYFDNTLAKNWAGPEHWKLRRPPTATTTSTSNAPDQENAVEKPKRKQKTNLQIEFDNDENDEDEDVIFEQSSRKLTLSKEAMAKMTKQLLPDDIHFSSKQLLQYFLKPMFPTNSKKKWAKEGNINNATDTAAPLDDPDTSFWADQGQDYGDDIDYNYDAPTDNIDNNEQTQLTIYDDTSFYHDNYDDPEVSVLYGDTLITNHHTKKSKPLYVNYAKTAKRVDVKKLKDNLWKALTLAKDTSIESNKQQQQEEERVHGTQKFTDIVHNLKKMYSPKTMKDISVPFCFICLLHLANEKDLSIMGMGPQDDDDFVLGDDSDWMNNESILNEVTIVQNGSS